MLRNDPSASGSCDHHARSWYDRHHCPFWDLLDDPPSGANHGPKAEQGATSAWNARAADRSSPRQGLSRPHLGHGPKGGPLPHLVKSAVPKGHEMDQPGRERWAHPQGGALSLLKLHEERRPQGEHPQLGLHVRGGGDAEEERAAVGDPYLRSSSESRHETVHAVLLTSRPANSDRRLRSPYVVSNDNDCRSAQPSIEYHYSFCIQYSV
jgi:hypothetical protein